MGRTSSFILAGEVVAWGDSQLLTVGYVFVHAILHLCCVVAVALERTVDGSDGRTEPLTHDGVHVVHPEPQSRFEGDDHVGGDRVRRIQPIEPDALTGGAVVVVPRQLQRSAAVVVLSGRAWVLGVARIAVVLRSSVYFVNVAEICDIYERVMIFLGTLYKLCHIYGCVFQKFYYY